MQRKISLKTTVSSAIGIATMLVASGVAHAQAVTSDSPAQLAPDSDNQKPAGDIVVTGTLIRGIAPTGTDVITMDRQKIQASGVSSTTDLLAQIPQLNYFGSVPRANQDAGSPVFFPNLRNLGASGGQDTLLLINGHRMVGQGILSTTADPTIIPPSVLERVDVIPDGGSSIYGSDAIGGVINFITRKRMNGVEAASHYSFADNYEEWDADLAAGKDWGTGSAYIAYAYAWHNNLSGADRDYTTSNHLAQGGSDLRDIACNPGNITIGSGASAVTYALPGRVAGTVNRCDDPKEIDIYPAEKRHSVFASLTQALTPGLQFDLTAYWAQRDTVVHTAQATATGTITNTNPYFQAIGAETSQNVAFSYAGVFGPSNVTPQHFESYGTTAGFTWDVGGGWQIRAQGNVGRSFSEIHEDTVNASAATVALAGTTTATALNPYNLGATNPAVLAAIENYENHDIGVQELAEGRLVADGKLFALPGGDVRVAAGAEYHYNNLDQQLISGPRGTTGGTRTYSSRDVKSVFGELVVPVFGADNGMPGLRSLVLSGSVRHDEYSDVGGTTNPKLGVTYKPFNDLTIRGNWGTSFHAPGLESISATGQQAQVIGVSPYIRPGDSPLNFFRPTIILAGGNPNLVPETAHTWSIGFDWKPAKIPGLLLSATYYKVDFKNAIGLLSAATLFTDPNFSPFYIVNPTLAQAQAKTAGMTIVGVPNIATLYAVSAPYLLADARLQNFGGIKTDGIDFHAAYARPIGKVTALVDLAGNWTLDRKTATGSAGPWTDTLANGTGHLFFVATLGGKIGGFSARAAFNYRGGYPIKGLVNQDYIKSFQTLDAYLSYALPTHGLLADTQLTLNVKNLLDVGPPYANVSNINFSQFNGSTLGRLFEFGLRKKF